MVNIDFKLTDHRDGQVKGITHFDGNRRIIIYPHHHETIEDIYSTITHELIHYCIDRYKMVEMDSYQEHDLIFKSLWIDEYLSLNDI